MVRTKEFLGQTSSAVGRHDTSAERNPYGAIRYLADRAGKMSRYALKTDQMLVLIVAPMQRRLVVRARVGVALAVGLAAR